MEDDGGYGLLDYMRSDEEPELGRTVVVSSRRAASISCSVRILFPGHGLPVISDVTSCDWSNG